MTPVYPIHPDTRRFIAAIQRATTLYAGRCGMSLEEAAEGASALGASLEAAFADGTLMEMPDNVIVREMRRGLVPVEFREGCDFPAHIIDTKVTPEIDQKVASDRAVPVFAPQMRAPSRSRETDSPAQAFALDIARQAKQLTLGRD